MYLLVCCQDGKMGGLRDKPGKMADLYHTCYSLSGLSISQELVGTENKILFKNREENILKVVDPIFNIEASKIEKAMKYFASLPSPL